MKEDLFLFATIADTPIAVPAREIEAVVRLSEVVPVPLAPLHVRGLAALRSRVLTVIDLEARLFGVPAPDKTVPLAVVADFAAHSYGFLIDSVQDICPAPDGVEAIRGRIDPAWAPYVSGVVNWEARSHLLLCLADFVAAPAGTMAA